jgi:hypothetical protein
MRIVFDAVFGPAIRLLLSLLPAEAADLGHRHAVIAGTDEGVLNGIDLVMANNGFDLEHVESPESEGEGSPKNSSPAAYSSTLGPQCNRCAGPGGAIRQGTVRENSPPFLRFSPAAAASACRSFAQSTGGD